MSGKALTFTNSNDAEAVQRTYLLPLNKLDATAAPGTSNDDTQGYVAGSVWADRTNNKVYHCTDNATGAATWIEAGSGGGGGGSGTVTSVAMTVPAGFSVSGSPITTSGTLAVTADSQAANLVYASPASGGGAAPDFRALVTDDLANGLVTKAKIEDASEACLLGRGLGSGAGDVQEITLGSGITMSGASLIADTSVLATLADVAALEWTESAKTSSWTVAAASHVLYAVSVTGGDVVATLPPVSGNEGMVVAFKVTAKAGSSFADLTIDGDGSETIDGATSILLFNKEECVVLRCGATSWRIIADNRDRKWTTFPFNDDFTVLPITNSMWSVGMVTGSYTGAATLPAVSGNAGLVVGIKLAKDFVSTTPLTIDANSTETIDGALTCVLRVAGDCVILYCDGYEWYIISDTRAKRWTVSAKSADFTAGVVTNTNYHCDVSGANRTATLPAASGNAGLVLAFTLTVAPGANTLTIDGNSSETINGATTLLLYVLGDSVTLICDGSNWKILSDGRIAHTCRMTRAAGQSITAVTATKINLDTIDLDVGGIGDTTNKRVNIKRAGKYFVSVSSYMYVGSSAGGLLLDAYIYHNGTNVKYGRNASSAVGDGIPTIWAALDCAVNDTIELYLYYQSGTFTTNTAAGLMPSLFVQEVL